MRLSIIIVTYNNAVTIEDCLKSIFGNLSAPPFEILVVDNASTDQTVEIVKKFSGVKLIRNQENLGFAVATNRALKIAKGKYFFLLNPDAERRLP